MTILVKIPTEDFNAIQFNNAEELGVEFAQDVFDRIVASEEIIDRDFSAIKGKCIVCPHYATYNIPDNATNGDMVKAMFPYGQYGTNGDEVHVFRVGGNGVLVFSLNWWNAPYKAESEE